VRTAAYQFKMDRSGVFLHISQRRHPTNSLATVRPTQWSPHPPPVRIAHQAIQAWEWRSTAASLPGTKIAGVGLL
jgi:hypothetical protein